MSRTARGTITRVLVGLLAALLALAGPLPAASADPTVGPSQSDELPVEVELTTISPVIVTGDRPVHVEATLTNNGDVPVSDLWIRLQRDQWVGSRAQLQVVDEQPPPYAWAMSAPNTLPDTLEPGASISVKLTVTRDELVMYDTGAYPVLLSVYGTVDGWESHVGQTAFTVAHAEQAPATALDVAWVLPLIDRPHRVGGGDVFTDDALSDEIAPGGRLDTILSAAETHGEDAQLTLVVDPALVDDLDAMADGYKVKGDEGTTEGAGADRADAFLDRLRDVAGDTPIVATPYADVDTVALVRAGLPQVLSDARSYGADVIEDVLQVQPRTDIAWPADGVMTDAAWQALVADGVHTALLGGASFGQEDYLESPDGITDSAATALPDGRAIVADPGVTRLLSDAPTYAGGPVSAAQRVTAELAMIALQAPHNERNVVLVPPRTWDPSRQLLDALMERTTAAGWITPASLDDVAAATTIDRGALQYPPSVSTRELPVDALAAISSPLAQTRELSDAFNDDDAHAALWPTRAALLTASSGAWRGSGGDRVALGVNAAEDSLAAIRDKIRIVTPSGGTYTLTSSDAPLVITVENNLPWDVHYRIGIDESRSVGLSTDDIGVQTIPGGTRSTVQLPSTVERSGSFTVVAQISTPDGDRLGNDVQINVSSSAYGTVALWVTGLAFAALLALIARRWWRRHLFWAEERRKRADADEHQRREDAGDYGQHEYRSDEYADAPVTSDPSPPEHDSPDNPPHAPQEDPNR